MINFPVLCFAFKALLTVVQQSISILKPLYSQVAVPSSFTAESETGEKVDLSDTIVTGTMAMDIKDDIISYTATPGDIVSEVGRSPAGVENGTGNELGEVETENETKKGTRKEADMGLQNEEEK